MNAHPTSAEFSPERSAVIRGELVYSVEETIRATTTGRRARWAPALGLVLSGALLGGGISAAAVAFTSNPGAPAPPGVEPGGSIVTELGTLESFDISGSRDIPLSNIPAEATHVRVAVMCLTPGMTSWGLDAGGNNPSSSCEAHDVLTSSWYDFAVAEGDVLFVDVSDDAESRVSLRYLDSVETAWGVNESGETYGADRPGLGAPDLTAVVGVAPTGEPIRGYVRSDALLGSGPDRPGLPSSPEEALEWQAEREAKYPNGWDIPLFASDGVTQLGTFRVGG